MDPKGKLAVITGGSRGLGAAIALGLASRGADILLTYRADETSATEMVKRVERFGVDASAVQLDLCDEASIDSLVGRLGADGGAAIVVNNAGEIPRPGDWDALRGNALRRTIDANLTGHIYLIQQIVPHLDTSSGGVIINISSTYGIIGAAPVMAYTAAKAGMLAVTYSLARELGGRRIRVNAIAPGNFDTAMADDAGPEFVEWVEKTTPLGRLGRPEEIAHAVNYLVEADYVNGHVLVVDGGHILNV